MKILVIEDQPSELKLADHVLSAAGHFVNGLGDTAEALAAIQRDRPDLILLDMSLPGMDGLEMVRILKADPETSEILIVAVTSHPEKYPKHLALEVGCDAYLSKPLSTRTLPDDLSQVVNKISEVNGS